MNIDKNHPSQYQICLSCHRFYINPGSKLCEECTNFSNMYYPPNGEGECPPIMSDGRFLTNYVSTRHMGFHARDLNNMQDDRQNRYYQQHNADQIFQKERIYLQNKYTCHPQKKCSEGWIE